VILDGAGNIRRIDRVSRIKLIRLIQRYRPMRVALDNVYELAKQDDLQPLISSLPDETKIIQVTGVPGEETSLQLLAIKHNIKCPAKFSPVEEAETCARLAFLGIGAEVIAFENETRILVCRDVSLGPGGSSQSRYRRNVHVSILTAAKQIERKLEASGLDFDLFTEESDFGLERAEFIVYSSKSKLTGLLRPFSSNCINVKVLPVYRRSLEFVPLNPITVPSTKIKNNKLIVGIDPGTSCGLAVLTLDGKPLYVDSHKGLCRGDVIRIITELGDPILFAADVSPPPEFVTKLAKGFDAVIFQPESFLGAMEKHELAREYAQRFNIGLKNQHARDALAAAVKAFNHYKAKLVSIEAELSGLGNQISLEEVKALVIKGYAVQKAVEILRPQFEYAEIEEQNIVEQASEADLKLKSLREVVSFYKARFDRLKNVNRRLNEQIRLLEGKIKGLEAALESERKNKLLEIRRERAYQLLQREVDALRRELDSANARIQSLEQTTTQISGSWSKEDEIVPLKPIEAFTRDGLEKAFKLFNVKSGDIVLIINSSGGGASTANELVQRGVKAVISQNNMAHQAFEVLDKYEIPVISSNNVKIKWLDGKPYASKTDIEKELVTMRSKQNIEIEKKIEEILEEYRRERQV
jgi:predicted RNase H-like nuclease (RuvC/YqgF family)